MGQTGLAFDHFIKYTILKDSIFNKQIMIKQTEAELNYQFDKKTAQDSIRNAEQANQKEMQYSQKIREQRAYTYGGIIGIVLMIIVTGVSFRAYKLKKKTNTLISKQKNLLEEKQKEILVSIHYAKRIQQSLLPNEKYIDKNLKRLNKKA